MFRFNFRLLLHSFENYMLMFFMGNIIQDFSNFQQARQKNCTEWHPWGLSTFLQIELWSFVPLFKNKYVLLLSWRHVLHKALFKQTGLNNSSLKLEKYLCSCLAPAGMITILIRLKIVTLMVWRGKNCHWQRLIRIYDI